MRAGTLALVLLVAACAAPDAADDADAGAENAAMDATALPAEIESIKSANDKYQDVNTALAEGFIEDPSGMCVTATEVGAPAELGNMGIHYISLQGLGVNLPPGAGPQPPGVRLDGTDGVIDPMRPEVLVYEPTSDGGRTLVGIEYLVFKQAWEAAGNTAPPSVGGQEFYLMADDPATEMDEAHGFEPHYELHVWTHRPNPSGLFAEWNPAVTCPPMAAGGASR
jgi:hypothetical protein